MSSSTAERALANEIRWLKLPVPEREYWFAKAQHRRWRFDFAWVTPHLLAVEVEGGGYVQGRHTRGKDFERDCEKYNEAVLLGWRILRVTPAQIVSGEAVHWIERGLESHADPA